MMSTELKLPRAPEPVINRETFRTSSRIPGWMERLHKDGFIGNALYSVLLFLWF